MKPWVIWITAVAILVTGCRGSDLEEYQKAVEATESYETGVIQSDTEIGLTFNEEGLTFEEIRDLSYFEEIVTSSTVTYDATGDDTKSIVEGYYNFGGLGFDMILYFDGDEMLMKLPIMDRYLDIEAAEGDGSEVDFEDQEAAVSKLIDTWNDVLMDENVFSGERAYVMTDRGQLKTTTYTLTIDEDQFGVMKSAVLEIIEDERFVEAFLEDGNAFADYDITAEEIQAHLTELFEGLELVEFTGRAYVDFDGRLVRQVFEGKLSNTGSEPGDVETITISYESNYDRLGETVDIVIPEISEEDLLDVSEDGSLEDYFPEGLFE